MTLSTGEIEAFDRRRDAIDFQYQTGLVNNTNQQSILDFDEGIAGDRLTSQLRNARQRLPGGYVGRGLFNSGFYQRGLKDFNIGALDSQADLARNFAARRSDLFASLQGLDASRAIQLAQVDLDEQTRRSAVASLLGSVA